MLLYEYLADVTFSVGVGLQKVEMKAHKFMLASRSATFFSMFCGTETANKNDVISIDEVEPDVFRKLLRYIYTNEVDITTKSVTALLHGAKRFKLGGLVELCSRKLAEGIALDTACTLLEQAHQYQEPTLEQSCLDFIYKNAHTVLTSPQFSSLCPQCLTKVLESDELRADESVVYKAMLTWASRACNKQKLPVNGDSFNRVLGKLKYLVRFPVLDIDFFSKHVTNDGILTKDEVIEVFKYLHSRTAPNLGRFITRRRAMTRAYRFDVSSGAWNVGNVFCDAIQFQSSREIVLDGVIIYGCYIGEASYDVSVRILGERHQLIVQCDSELQTSAKTELYDVLLNNGVTLKAMTWYTIVLYMEGPQTKRGVCGKNMIYCEQVQFFFKTSILTQNCTTEREGQIPGIIFH
ncbi:BTB/POZ domain-containing protein 6-like [Dreissena polymorpha]|nr:BTB/POZ domain-containing protein 6-like [Dreissena polymorpha]